MATKPAPVLKLRIHINILYPQGLPQNIGIKLTRWILTYGRIILILVELMVLGTFAMRFKLDSNLADLKDKIDEQVPYIQSLAPDEYLIKHTQYKLDLVKKTFDSNPRFQKMAQKMTTITPAGIKFNTFTVDGNQPNVITFRINGKSSSNSDLAVFVNNLKKDPTLKDIALSNIGLDEGTIVFTINGVLKT